MNHAANVDYTARWRDDGVLDLPVLFLAARYDYTCESTRSSLADPMRALCPDLAYRTLDCGHWMAQEKPREVNAALARWLVERVPHHWPTAG